MLELQGVCKRYDGHTVVDGVSIVVPAGEILSLLGPSGCGKSTTLRMVAGLTEVDQGTILIAGDDVTRRPAAKRNIGMVFQSLALFPHMTVDENVGFGLKCQGVSVRDRKPRVDAALARVRLNGFGARMPWQLSGGQRQRVALARALVTGPNLLLLDEPFSALDRNLRDEMQRELREVVREVGITTIFVTHDQEEAIRLSDRIAVMQHGRIVQIDSPRVIYERPRTRFIAQFVGSPNLLPVTYGPPLATTSGVPIAALVSAELAAEADCGKHPLLLNVRPERIRIHASAPAQTPSLEGHIDSFLYEGEVTTYWISLTHHPNTVWTVREPAREAMASQARHHGDTVYLSWNEQDGHLLADGDTPSEKRVERA